MLTRNYYVYILSSRPRGVLYVGVTNDLIRRVYEHRTGAISGFTKRYQVKRLVYYEMFEEIERAIAREKRFKKWPRAWKVEAIEEENPDWKDLYPTLLES